MAQFNVGDLREKALPRYIIDEDGNVLGTVGNPLEVTDAGSGASSVVLGTVADAAVITDAPGSISGKLRGIVALLVNLLSRWPAALAAGGGLKVEGVAGGVAQPVSLATAPALVAGEAHVGEVGGNTITVTVTPTLTVAGAYIAGDFVGTSATAGVIANAARVAGKGGVLESVAVIDGDKQSVAGELWLFDTAVTPPADNAAWTITDADAATVIPGGVIPLSTYYASALNSVAVARGVALSYTCVATSLYFCFVTRGAPTYTSGKLSLRFNFMRD